MRKTCSNEVKKSNPISYEDIEDSTGSGSGQFQGLEDYCQEDHDIQPHGPVL